MATDVSINGVIRALEDATVFVVDGNRYIKIDSPLIEHDVEQKRIQSEYGRLQIYVGSKNSYIVDSDLYYQRLFVELRDDEVPVTIVLKEIIR